MENGKHYNEYYVHVKEINPRTQSTQTPIDGIVFKINSFADNENAYPPPEVHLTEVNSNRE